MELHCLSLPPLGANCYLLKLRDRLDGLVIDPGARRRRWSTPAGS